MNLKVERSSYWRYNNVTVARLTHLRYDWHLREDIVPGWRECPLRGFLSSIRHDIMLQFPIAEYAFQLDTALTDLVDERVDVLRA